MSWPLCTSLSNLRVHNAYACLLPADTGKSSIPHPMAVLQSVPTGIVFSFSSLFVLLLVRKSLIGCFACLFTDTVHSWSALLWIGCSQTCHVQFEWQIKQPKTPAESVLILTQEVEWAVIVRAELTSLLAPLVDYILGCLQCLDIACELMLLTNVRVYVIWQTCVSLVNTYVVGTLQNILYTIFFGRCST